MLREIGAGYVLSSKPLAPPFEAVAQSERVVVYRVPGALPMAYLITPRGVKLRPRDLALDASSARAIVESNDGGLFVLTQNDEPSWHATIDGRDAQTKLAYGAFRAVDVAPGKHEVVWKYRPLSLVAGAIVTLLTLLAIIAALMLSR